MLIFLIFLISAIYKYQVIMLYTLSTYNFVSYSSVKLKNKISILYTSYLGFFFLFLFKAASVAYGSSWAGVKSEL